jgi:uncharacterized protein with ATP-grasp and redox domains
MIRTDHSNAFANRTMKARVPAIIREVSRLNPDYPPAMHDALEQHAQAMENDVRIPMLTLPAPDYEAWYTAWQPRRGESWLNTDWFFAEVYNYRLLMQIVRWFELGRDPFAPQKLEEINGASLWQTLERALALRDLPYDERLTRMIHFDLWGNRIDLSYSASLALGSHADADDLLVDDSEAVTAHLLNVSRSPRRRTVHVVADNTGTELALDLAFADVLLSQVADQVVFHLKAHPTFVSDALPADALIFIATLERQGGEMHALSERLYAALNQGRLRLIPDPYWNSTRLLHDLPPHLARTFRDAALVIIKGDANYRRMVGDICWPSVTPYAEVVSYFRAPILALRTMKSDPVVGLAAGKADALDEIDAQWRINGKRGVIQAARLR